ncbi:probable LRR receptor-like serine/threonine-protein kinase At1g63430 [Amborella trichopoda]|uniref:probable LRR receptor-like serine/threonine-protein kinase At1g63430 n=1 Tax=Amborella trichopoda TaxID=13333 RepID=UPI0005D369DB|nr:probable LRR receptor-like serine/threonine-protein kinase At1g63430 [Amborella trichopoda]|eukprot:XP_011622868.1 probable LRR receptor-like serine/threonine-protein kinase At1g63430 [Amborella trichopoda]
MRSLTFVILSVIWGVLSLPSHSATVDEVKALWAFKEAIYEDPLSVLSNWNSLDADPCDWLGIVCSPYRGSVIALNLSSSSFNGFLAPELGLLNSLETLNLHNNHIIGPIPKQLGGLKRLKVIDLGYNQLSGAIPNELGNLTSIIKINLQSNELIGSIPPELGALKNLWDLRLDRNRLQGTIPGSVYTMNFTSNMQGMYAPRRNSSGFCQSNQLRIADFSHNFFVGQIPQCLNYLPRYSFQWNCLDDRGSSNQRPSQQCIPDASTRVPASRDKEEGEISKRSSKSPWVLILEISTGIVAGIIVFFVIVTTVQRCRGETAIVMPWRKTSNGHDQIALPADGEMLKDVLLISREDLETACEDFSNIIGSSPDSVVYKGITKDGQEIAVISLCMSKEYWTCSHELYFQSQVADLARLNHENIAKLLGYCKESEPFSRMLVFEYASNGTLYEHLHFGEGAQLSWSKRMKIIIGIARGLRYLHSELQPPYILSELSSSAIYLTEDFSPKAKEFLEVPEMISYLVDPALKQFRYEDLRVVCEVVTLCIQVDPSNRPLVCTLASMLENGINTSPTVDKESPLAWAERVLNS